MYVHVCACMFMYVHVCSCMVSVQPLCHRSGIWFGAVLLLTLQSRSCHRQVCEIVLQLFDTCTSPNGTPSLLLKAATRQSSMLCRTTWLPLLLVLQTLPLVQSSPLSWMCCLRIAPVLSSPGTARQYHLLFQITMHHQDQHWSVEKVVWLHVFIIHIIMLSVSLYISVCVRVRVCACVCIRVRGAGWLGRLGRTWENWLLERVG
jgi:hypothetical protein